MFNCFLVAEVYDTLQAGQHFVSMINFPVLRSAVRQDNIFPTSSSSN